MTGHIRRLGDLEDMSMKKKLLLAVVVSMLAAMTFGGVASAHVHGITPLLQISVDNADKSGDNAP